MTPYSDRLMHYIVSKQQKKVGQKSLSSNKFSKMKINGQGCPKGFDIGIAINIRVE
jgi:hypothetical protein